MATMQRDVCAHECEVAPVGTLAAEFDPRSNSLNTIRLLLATVVAVVHASMIGYGHQPHIGATEVGALAVDAFFVISGFLVARSFVRLDSMPLFVWHRFLRIMPAFWTCLVATVLLVAPLMAWLEGLPASSVFGADPSAWRYAIDNALLFIAEDRFGVAGLPHSTCTPGVVNGALWTLFYEAVCYGLVVVLGVVGALTRRRVLVLALGFVVPVVLLAQEMGLLPERGQLYLRFFTVFVFGVLAYLYAERIRLRRRWLVGAMVVVLGSLLAFEDYRWLGAAAFAYICMYAVVRTPPLRRSLRSDLSYGVYVFHWPVETVLVLAGATALTQAGYILLALLLTAGLAALSWRFVESPALSHKSTPPWESRRPPGQSSRGEYSRSREPGERPQSRKS